MAGLLEEGGSGRAYVRMQEWQGLCKNAGVAGLMKSVEVQDLCKGAGVAGLM